MQNMPLKLSAKMKQLMAEHRDDCSECSRPFETDETTYLGYTNSKKLIYVGDCCSSKLKEPITIFRHSYKKRKYEIPHSKATLWRFMDFTKFVSLLKSKSLYFTRADKFDDPFEGAQGLLENKEAWDKRYLDFFISICTSDGSKLNKTETEILIEAQRLLKEFDQKRLAQLQRTFISCWHENEHESEAMWKLYTSTLNQGIAIKTSYNKLCKSLSKNPSIQIGQVNYIDFSKNGPGLSASFWSKRKSFAHEREVRAIFFEESDAEVALYKLIPVDLNILIDEIYVSPISEQWFKEVVADIMKKYGVKKKIGDSSMKAKAFH